MDIGKNYTDVIARFEDRNRFVSVTCRDGLVTRVGKEVFHMHAHERLVVDNQHSRFVVHDALGPLYAYGQASVVNSFFAQLHKDRPPQIVPFPRERHLLLNPSKDVRLKELDEYRPGPRK